MATGSSGMALVSDLDHTMVQNEDIAHRRLLAFNHVWNVHGRAPGNLLVFSTGRSPTLFAQLWEEAPLLTPDVLICSVGTEIFYNVSSPVARLLLGNSVPQPGTSSAWAAFTPDPHWEKVLDQGWDRAQIQQLVASECPQLKQQAFSEQRPHKLSYTLSAELKPQADVLLDGLRAQLAKQGLSAKIIYSGGQDVDVLAQGAGKGCGLAFLLKRLKESGWDAQHVQVNGDSGNDSELLDVPDVVGCVVANAHPELRAHAQTLEAQGATHVLQARNPCAGGIVEAMSHFGLIPPTSPVLASYRGLLHLPSAGTAATGRRSADAIPRAAEPAPPEGASAVVAPAREVPEDSPAITAAAQAVSGDLGPAELGTGDTAGQHLPPGAVCGKPAQPYTLTLEEGAREWAWRLGLALAEQLAHGGVQAWGQGGELPAHSPLRLMVSNICKLAVKGAGGAAAAGSAGLQQLPGGSDADAWEVVDSLDARGAADVAHEDAIGAGSRAWVDQLVITSEAPAPTPDTPDAAAKARLALRFKVCTFRATGMRSPVTWEVHVTAQDPVEPVPHGFLADSLQVVGPLADSQRRLGLPGLA